MHRYELGGNALVHCRAVKSFAQRGAGMPPAAVTQLPGVAHKLRFDEEPRKRIDVPADAKCSKVQTALHKTLRELPGRTEVRRRQLLSSTHNTIVQIGHRQGRAVEHVLNPEQARRLAELRPQRERVFACERDEERKRLRSTAQPHAKLTAIPHGVASRAGPPNPQPLEALAPQVLTDELVLLEDSPRARRDELRGTEYGVTAR